MPRIVKKRKAKGKRKCVPLSVEGYLNAHTLKWVLLYLQYVGGLF